MWKIINNSEPKSITFAHFKTEWTARRRKAGWETKQPPPRILISPGQSPVNLFANKSNSIDADEHFAVLSAGCTPPKIQKLVNKKTN